MTSQSRPPEAAPSAARRRPRKGMGPAAAMGLFLFGALTLLGVAGAAASVVAFTGLMRDLPGPQILEQIELPEQSVVYDRTGKTELARFGEFNREVVTFAEIPPVLVDATTAVEDRTFWENSGFDPVGIVAAGLDAIRGNARGASTITQQLVRQRLLTTDTSASAVPQTERSAERKLKEIIQSIRVTEAFPGEAGKQRIMAAYLNQNFYGNESYGVAAAAQSYFGVPLKDITLAQAAILASLPKAPSTYDLVQNAVEQCVDPNASADTCTKTQLVVPADSTVVQRRNQVLDLMSKGRTPLTGGTYTAADFEAAKAEPVVLAPQRPVQWTAPQFVWQVRRELAARLCDGAETCPLLERGGLKITSTLDMRLQGLAEKWVKAATVVPHAKNPRVEAKRLGLTYEPWMENLRNKKLYNGALVAQDYQTGELVAYVGSADPYATKATKKLQPRFDVLADGWRQPGSAFKPIVYGTGIEDRKITAATMFMDVVTNFGGGYTPTDADNTERGPVRVEIGRAHV
jgi:membrane peptidoglycan carboxypeptidase